MTSAPTTTAPATHDAPRRRLATATGAAAVLGGAAWVTAAAIHASQPVGCVGAGCTTTLMREATTATSVLMALAGMLVVASGAGLVLAVRRAGRLGSTGVVGAALAAAGATTLASALVLQAAFFDDSWSLMPWFVGPGVLALAVGTVLLGWTVLRSGVLPRWVGVAVIAGAVLLALSNEQTTAVLLAVPFGVAWALLGLALLSRARGAHEDGGISRNEVR